MHQLIITYLKRFIYCLALMLPSQMYSTTLPLIINHHTFQTELALSPQTRQFGLMKRTNFKANQAMLFVFPTSKNQAFWMKNTPINLWIAFINHQGTIVQAESMKKETLDIHRSTQQVYFAIETLDTPTNRKMFHLGQSIKNANKFILPLVKTAT